MSELDPQTPLETIFATEIMSANWRLRRCRVIEADLANVEPNEKTQRSVDRARAQSHNILRRSLAELRRLQTERAIRAQVNHAETLSGLAETSKILRAAKADGQPGLRAPAEFSPSLSPVPGSFCRTAASEGSICKPAETPRVSLPKTPRNAPCPCGSGVKYKRCCGNPAASNRPMAA